MFVYSNEVNDLPISESYLEYSDAYLFSAITICNALIENPDQLTYTRGCACIFNARLSVELFLKAALIKKNPNNQSYHAIEKLGSLYKKNYPEPQYHWDIPFMVEVLGASSEEEKEQITAEHIKEMPHDQFLRYPTNKSGKPWKVADAFSARGFMEVLNVIQADMQRLKHAIFS